jgi:hypothetical protein
MKGLLVILILSPGVIRPSKFLHIVCTCCHDQDDYTENIHWCENIDLNTVTSLWTVKRMVLEAKQSHFLLVTQNLPKLWRGETWE